MPAQRRVSLDGSALGAAEEELHHRFLAGEPDASYDTYLHYAARVCAWLRREFRSLGGDSELEGCAIEALADYFAAPRERLERMASARGLVYLAARRNALNLLEQRRRRREREIALEEDSVAETTAARNDPVEEALGILPGLPDEITVDELWARAYASVRPADHRVLDLMLSGDEPLASYAAVLRLETLPREEQEHEVKKAKDRVRAGLRRLGKSYGSG